MFRSHSLDLSFIRRGRKRSSAARSASQTALRANVIVMAVSTAEVGSSKRSRGLADIDPKFVSKSGLGGVSEVETPRGGSVRIQHRPPRPASTVQSRFPKLDECAHFHYEVVDLGSLTIQLSEEGLKCEENGDRSLIAVQVCSQGKSWIVRRSVDHFRAFDEQLHRCVYDRKFSLLPAIPDDKTITTQHGTTKAEVALRPLLSDYVTRLSCIAGNLINCAPVLNWLEVDNRGRRLIPPDDADINTPAVAAAYAVRRYAAQASDEITFEVGDMISVIDMPPPEESVWWRGKRGFDVGFFPYECVRVIGDKVPVHLSLPGASGAAVQPGDLCSSASSSSDSGTLPSKPVLRKHGKLISFFRSFILSRPSRRKLKQSGILKERVFGCDLGEHLLNSGKEIPMVLKCCAEFIEEYGIVDGIYRLSGVTSNIQKLRNTFDEDRVPSLEGDEAIRQDIHAVSSLLKMYFRELPNPLCTYQLYDQFVSAVQGPEDLRVVRMRAVVQQLPPPHYRTLEYLVRHLARVAEHNGSTGMTAKNVAIVWAPNLLRCKELEVGGVAALQGVGIQAVVTECLIKYVELIFSDKLPALPPPQLADNPRRSRPKSLAISAPTKLLSLEEARNRALQLAIQNDTQYIEVGGGPASLPTKYHTVIDLPKRGNSLKHKKSPSGWKSLFAKSRSPSSKHRKGSTASTGSTSSTPVITAHQSQRAVTYTRPKLRPVKSAESLSNRNSKSEGSPNQSSPMLATVDTPPPEIAAEENVAAEATPTRCHSRSVSHDSYFHLLQLNRNAMSLAVGNPVDEEELTENGETSLIDDKYYEGLNLATGTDFSKEVLEGTEFGRGLKLAAVEDAVSSESKTSLNNLSHLDDSELNIMNSREMLAVSRRDDFAKPRQASSDDSAVANSSKAERKSPSPLNAEPLNDVETWVASNPAYELFCVQAEVHRQRNTPSPLSPDNTEAQVTDMTSEVAEDSDSLENVEECSLANATVSERESFTLHTNSVSNETYENFGEPSPGAGCYENVIDRSIVDEEYEPIETPTTSPSVHIEDVNACYENVEAPEANLSNARTCYENVEVPEANLSNAGTCYENVEVPEANLSNVGTSYENVDSEESPGVSYENVECCTEAQLAGYELMSNEPTPSCEQIETEEISGLYENVDLYEDVIPPPPAPTATAQEDQVYQQVKVLRQSIQEVNEILKGDHYPHPNQSESLPPAVSEPQPAAVEEVATTPVDESLPPAVSEPQPASVEEVATTPVKESLPPAVPEPQPAAVEDKPTTPSADDVVSPRSLTPKTVKEEGPRDLSPCRRPTKGPVIAPKPQIEPKKRPVFAKDVVMGDKEDAKSLSLSLPSLEHQAKPLKVVPDHTQSLPTTPAAPVNVFPASPQNKKTQSPVSESPPKRPTSLDAEAADSRLRRPCSRFGNERQPSVKELLNKFQSGSGSETLSSSNSSSDEKTKTSPTTPTSPLLLLHSSKEMDDTSKTLEIKGKENIEISSIKDFANESKEDVNKDDKTSATIVGVDMSDPRTRLRIERYKEERRSFLREKYKLEAFRADTKEDDVIVRLKMKAGSPTRPLESELLAQPDAQRPTPGLLDPEPGLIDEDVNVKERAALWSTSTTSSSSSSSPVKIPKRAEEKSEVKISSPEKVAPPQRRIKNIAAIFEKDSH